MKNFPIEKGGKEYWVSRSIAAVTYVFANVNGVPCVLANKRGPGLPNNVGKWNAPSGFLDYDETLEGCAAREVYEETGIVLGKDDIHFYTIDSNPERTNQVVLARFYAIYKGDPNVITNEHCEPNEVEEVRWVPIKDLDGYDWTSKVHIEKLKECYNNTIGGFDGEYYLFGV